MLDQLSDHWNEEFGTLLLKVGIDEAELLNEEEVLRILDMFIEPLKEDDEESDETLEDDQQLKKVQEDEG